MAKTESSTEDYVVDWAKKQNIPCFKLKLDTNSGWPDREFLLPGRRPAFIEFKRPGERPTKLQHYRILTLKRLGYDAIWTTSAQAAIRWLEALQTSPVSEAGD